MGRHRPAFATPTAAAAVFFALALRQTDRPWLHGMTVGSISWFASFAINVLVIRQAVVTWVLEFPFIGLSLAAGTGLALRLRR